MTRQCLKDEVRRSRRGSINRITQKEEVISKDDNEPLRRPEE